VTEHRRHLVEHVDAFQRGAQSGLVLQLEIDPLAVEPGKRREVVEIAYRVRRAPAAP